MEEVETTAIEEQPLHALGMTITGALASMVASAAAGMAYKLAVQAYRDHKNKPELTLVED
jgi:hypothetical protein